EAAEGQRGGGPPRAGRDPPDREAVRQRGDGGRRRRGPRAGWRDPRTGSVLAGHSRESGRGGLATEGRRARLSVERGEDRARVCSASGYRGRRQVRTNAEARAAVAGSLFAAGAWSVSEYTVPGAGSFVGLRA